MIVILGCGSSKHDRSMPAIFLGGSDYYDLCREAFVRVESILPKAIIHRQHLFMARLRERLENGIE